MLDFKEKDVNCHKCNTKMNLTDIVNLTGEQIDSIIEQIDFPFFVRSKKAKIAVITLGYDFFVCPNCKNWRAFNHTKVNIC